MTWCFHATSWGQRVCVCECVKQAETCAIKTNQQVQVCHLLKENDRLICRPADEIQTHGNICLFFKHIFNCF